MDKPSLKPMTEADLASAIQIHVSAMRARGEIKAATAGDGFARMLAAKLWQGNVRPFQAPPCDAAFPDPRSRHGRPQE